MTGTDWNLLGDDNIKCHINWIIVIADCFHREVDNTEKQLPTLEGYVENIFICVPFDKIDNALVVFNDFHSEMQYIIENEHKNSIHFLDII